MWTNHPNEEYMLPQDDKTISVNIVYVCVRAWNLTNRK